MVIDTAVNKERTKKPMNNALSSRHFALSFVNERWPIDPFCILFTLTFPFIPFAPFSVYNRFLVVNSRDYSYFPQVSSRRELFCKELFSQKLVSCGSYRLLKQIGSIPFFSIPCFLTISEHCASLYCSSEVGWKRDGGGDERLSIFHAILSAWSAIEHLKW